MPIKLLNISSPILILFILGLYLPLVWSANKLIYQGPVNKLVMTINNYYPRQQVYLSKYRLLDKNNKVLNEGKLYGCTYGGIINNISDYVQKQQFIVVTPIQSGFAIHYLVGCGAQSIWQLHVITPTCTASVPATNAQGKRIEIGNDPYRIKFGYLEGFGALRKVKNAYLILDHNNVNIIRNSGTVNVPNEKNMPKIICQ